MTLLSVCFFLFFKVFLQSLCIHKTSIFSFFLIKYLILMFFLYKIKNFYIWLKRVYFCFKMKITRTKREKEDGHHRGCGMEESINLRHFLEINSNEQFNWAYKESLRSSLPRKTKISVTNNKFQLIRIKSSWNWDGMAFILHYLSRDRSIFILIKRNKRTITARNFKTMLKQKLKFKTHLKILALGYMLVKKQIQCQIKIVTCLN